MILDSFAHYPLIAATDKWVFVSGGGAAGGGPGGNNRQSYYGSRVVGAVGVGSGAWTGVRAAGGFSGSMFAAPVQQIYTVVLRNPIGFSPEHCVLRIDNVFLGDPTQVTIAAYRGATATLLQRVHIPLVQDDYGTIGASFDWHQFTWEMGVGNTNGYAIVKYNGTVVLSVSGVDTQIGGDPTITSVRFSASTNGEIRFTDVHMFDPDASVYGNLLDQLYITYVAPDTAGTHADSTIGGSSPAPTRLESIFEQVQDDGVTLNVLSTQGDKDSFGLVYGDLLDLEWRVVQLVVRARKVGAGNASIAGILRSGGTEHQTTAKVLTGIWETLVVPMELSPFTSGFWSPGEVDEVGYVASVLDPGTTIEISQAGLEVGTEEPVAGGVMHIKALD